MNSLVGKSTGIALLLAAGLLAALFAMGVFAPTGVGANVKSNPAPTASLSSLVPEDEDVTLTVTFQINDDIDGAPSADQANDDVTITLSNTIAGIATNFDTDNITVTQGGNPVGKVVDPIGSPGQIVITVADEGDDNVVKDETVTVTISDLTLADTAVTTPAAVSISQTGQSTPQTASLSIYDPDNALSGLSATLSDNETEADDVTLTLKFTTAEGQNNDVVITLPPEYDVQGDSPVAGITVTVAVGTAVATVLDGDRANLETGDTITISSPTADSDYTVTVGANIIVDPPTGGFTNPESAGDFEVKFAQGTIIPARTAMFAVSAPAPPADPEVTLSSKTPGAAVQITITANAADAITPNQDITVDFKDTGFVLPEAIADSSVDIASEDFDGSPNNVLVSGEKVTMTVPTVRANGDPQTADVMGNYTIRIKQSAGITNPAAGGEKTVKWQENAPDGDKKEAKVTIERVITLSKKDGTRGTESTATFKGFANGTATINLNDAKLGEVTIADNLGTYELDTTSTKFLANQENVITAQDAGGNNQGEDGDATFTIKPKVVLDPEETSVSKEVTLKLSDWPVDHDITTVTIGASPANPASSQDTDDEGKAEFKVMVPADANRGSQTVKVTGTKGDLEKAPSATATLKVGVLTLTIQPASVVPGQQITIEGSGFKGDDEIDEVTVGSLDVAISPAAEASSAGDIVITINIPSPSDGDGIGHGTKKVSVAATTGSGRVAEGSIEIPKPTATLSPAESRRGTTVNVSGIGFPSGDLVQVKYDNNGTFVTVAAGPADASGAVSINFDVPSYAKIGTKHDVEATSVGVYAGVTAEAIHETPGAQVTLSSKQIASGETLTLSGMNFPAFATVAIMEIGGVDVRPVPAPATSIDGDFESTVLVPGLELGNQTVSVRVSQTTITTFLEIVASAAPSAPADVFASLGDRLVRVWSFDASAQATGNAWSFYDPDPQFAGFNTLAQVSSGDIVTIIIGEGETVEFASNPSTLYPGSNYVALD